MPYTYTLSCDSVAKADQNGNVTSTYFISQVHDSSTMLYLWQCYMLALDIPHSLYTVSFYWLLAGLAQNFATQVRIWPNAFSIVVQCIYCRVHINSFQNPHYFKIFALHFQNVIKTERLSFNSSVQKICSENWFYKEILLLIIIRRIGFKTLICRKRKFLHVQNYGIFT